MTDFTHLHVHTEYSLLDGMARFADLLVRAKELGMDGLAITDHGSMYGAVGFYRAAQQAGIKPIIGMEAYMAAQTIAEHTPQDKGPAHLILLAKNETGYRNLIKLTTAANIEGFYYKPRIDHALLEQYHDGLIALSACAAGEVPTRLLAGDRAGARRTAAWYRDLFGEDYYLEVQEHGIAELDQLTPQLIALGRELDIPLVATNDSHYVRREEAQYHDVLLAIQTQSVMADPKRMRMEGDSFYVKSQDEMAELFGELPESLRQTRAIAEKCNLRLDFDRLRLPAVEVPAGFTEQGYLTALCEEGLRRKYDPITPEAEERLRYELDVIDRAGFVRYVLIVCDFAREARERRIPFGVRGSAAGSIVCYCLGITDVDPLAWRLPFERFLNIERQQMPDIDMDFADNRRAEMIEYTIHKYGVGHVAQIVTFGTLGARAAIRDVGRALDMPLGEVDRIARMIPMLPVGITIDQAMKDSREFDQAYRTDPVVQNLIDIAKGLEGVSRHASVHAAGVVIARDLLTDHVPLQRATRGDEDNALLVTQYPAEDLETIGLLKMDFLGLANLTILGLAVDLIQQTRGEAIDLLKIPLNDQKAFEMLGAGETTGVFQLESAGMRRNIRALRPSSVEELAALIALYRPGPMDQIPIYINNKFGHTKPTYLHERLRPILEPTCGVIVYQDQVLFIAQAIAGYSLGQADILRKAMGKKKKEVMEQERTKFVAGAQAQGVDARTATQIFELMAPFAGYGFNAAHAACYAQVAYQTAYLKARYPVEYMTAFLTVISESHDKIAGGVAECARLGLTVLPPDVNHSEGPFIVAGPSAIRFGLNAVKNVGLGAVEAIVAVRRAGGPFTSLEDFCRRVDARQANRKVVESLIKGGTMDSLGHRAQLLDILDQAIAQGQLHQQAERAGQLDMFNLLGEPSQPTSFISLPDMPEIDAKTKLYWEKDLLGTYFSEHPLGQVIAALGDTLTAFCGEITADYEGQKVTVAGMVRSARKIVTKKGTDMAFAQLEDLQGAVEVVIFPDVYAATAELWTPDQILLVSGKVEVRDDKAQLICESAEPYELAEQPEISEEADQPSPAVLASVAIVAESPAPYVSDPDSLVPVPELPEEAEEPDEPFAGPPAVETEVAPAPPEKPAAPVPPPRTATREREPAPVPQKPGNGGCRVHITLNRSDDHHADILKLQRARDALMKYRGQDRFYFHLVRGSEQVCIEFPNDYTRYCAELERDLYRIVGRTAVAVERLNA